MCHVFHHLDLYSYQNLYCCILLRIYKSQSQCENTSSKLVGNEMHVLLSCFLALTVQSKAYNMEIQLENQTVSMDTTIYPQL